ncbi:MAG: glycosyltransferase family 4 protein [Lachnospiraceae bacterium]|nr:glycosyltransferase family 4 protein [Lachnospiraceae bacterium]
MKILILANNDVGLYKFRKELLEELVKEHEVIVCLPNGEWIESIKQLGCKYIQCEFNRRGMNPISELKLIQFYRKTIRDVKPDIVFTYTIKPNSYGGMVCAKLGVPYIANVTGLGTSIENGGLTQKITLTLYKRGLRKAKMVFFQNTYNCEFMVNKDIVKGKYQVLPGSGVNLNENCYEAYPSEDDGIKFLFVGRIMKDKGIEEYLYCAKKIHELHPECTFDIIGAYDEEAYQSELEKYEKDGIIKAFGHQKDVHSFMKSHHVLIHPSYHEGLSNVLLEAASCGRPVIASDIPGCKETFDEGISGIGFVPRSSEALVEAVDKLLALSAKEREQMGMKGREKIQKEFDRNIVINRYLEEIKKS